MSPETILVIALALIFGVLVTRLFKIIRIPQIAANIHWPLVRCIYNEPKGVDTPTGKPVELCSLIRQLYRRIKV